MLMNAFAKSSRSARIAFSAAIIGIVAVAAYNWIVSPKTKYLHAMQQYKLMTDDVTRKNIITKTKDVAKKKEIEKLRAKLANAQASLFTPAEAKRFFSDIEAVCNEANCILYSINFLSGDLGELSASVENGRAIVGDSANLSFAGSYGNIINFLAKLMNRPQRVLIRSLKIFTSGDGFDPLRCEIMITIYTLRHKEIFTNE